MATNIRVNYVVDDSQLQKSEKELQGIRKDVQGIKSDQSKTNQEFEKSNKETSKLNANIGGLKDTIGKLGLAAAVGAGVNQMRQAITETVKLRQEISKLTGASGNELDNITTSVRAISNQFNKDFNEVLTAGNSLMQQFGINSEEAFGLVEKGFLSGADSSGELLDSLREYPSVLKDTGIEANQLVDIIEESTKQGIFSDKGIDAVKEASIRIRELTPEAEKAINKIGLSGENLQRQLSEGSITMFEAIQKVSAQIDKLPKNSKAAGAAIANIFGGPGEDAGREFLTTLQDIDGEFENINEAQKEQLESQKDLDGAVNTLAKRFEGFNNEVLVIFNSTLAGTIQLFDELLDVMDIGGGVSERFKASQLSAEELNKEIESTESRLEEVNEKLEVKKWTQEQITEEEELQNRIQRERYARMSDEEKAVDAMFATETENTAELKEQERVLREQLAEYKEALQAKEETNAKEVDYKGNLEDSNDELEKRKELLEEFVKNLDNVESRGFGNQYKDLFKGVEEEMNKTGEEVPDNVPDELSKVKDETDQIGDAFLSSRDKMNIFLDDLAKGFKAASSEFIGGFQDTMNSMFEIRQNNLESQLNAVRQQQEAELEIAGDNRQAKERIEEKFAQRRQELQRQQAKNEKQQAIFNAVISQSQAIAKTSAQLGFPAALPFIAVATATTGAQIAAIKSQPTPKFAQGTKRVKGGEPNKDSVDAKVMPDEMIFPKDVANEYRPALESIFDRKVSPDVANKGMTNNINLDQDRVVEALNKQPRNHITVDEKGWTIRQVSMNKRVQRRSKKFSM